jgi:hypothetical protein
MRVRFVRVFGDGVAAVMFSFLFSCLAAMIFLLGGCVTSRIEEPKYHVVARHDGLEVRAYAPRILAQTTVDGSFEQAPNDGFRRIAKFIFGDNTSGDKVAMTAPVTQQSTAAGSWIITFTMPARYSMETLPKPVDDRVTLRQQDPKTYAALQFTGFNTRANVDEAIARVRQIAGSQGLKLRGEPIYARYNPPWTPWFWRRNEILIEVANP